jgi:hypothetical protein
MDIYQTKSYKENIIKSNYYILNFLLSQNIDFYMVCYVNVIDFNPPVPSSIVEFDETTLFKIANYTLESAELNNNSLIIETGFGRENFGSILTIPLEAIYQIIHNEELLAINYYKPQKPKDSMDIFLNNPENLKLFKK